MTAGWSRRWPGLRRRYLLWIGGLVTLRSVFVVKGAARAAETGSAWPAQGGCLAVRDLERALRYLGGKS